MLDDSGRDIPPEDLEAALSSVSAQLPDPLSARFRGLFPSRDGLVCGEVSSNDESGEDLGFVPFGYDTRDGSVRLLLDPSSLAGAADAAALSQGGCTWSHGRFEEHVAAERPHEGSLGLRPVAGPASRA